MKYVLKKDGSRGHFADIDFEKDLNSEQLSVINEADGPSLVLAGAGSGKTRTLVYRVAYLLNKGVPDNNILLVTFTNKAAHTMQDRVELLLKAKPKNLWSGTFHHIGNRSLRIYAEHLGYKRDFGILDEEDSVDLIKVCIKNLNIRITGEKLPTPKIIKKIISFSLNSGNTVASTIREYYPYLHMFQEVLQSITAEYKKRKKLSNVMDYDDLLVNWLKLLTDIPEARDRFAKQFKYILVDEYQDTNLLQAKIINNLSRVHRNVLVVGDDAQSIYSFRAADVSNILNFPNDYNNARVFKLESNYRSTPEILDLANNSIKNNANQFKKTLRTVKAHSAKPVLIEVTDPNAQASFIVQRALELRDEGVALNDVAVLFRAHYQSAAIEMELIKRNIPYVIRGGIRFFEQSHIKDVLAYMRILVNPLDELAWLRSLTMFPGIGTAYAGKIFDEFAVSGSLRDVTSPDFGRSLPGRIRPGLNQFKKIIKYINDEKVFESPDELIRRIFESGYEDYVSLHFDNAKDRIDDLHELINFAHQYKSIASLLHDITLRESFRGETVNKRQEDDEYLILSTIHQSKGLEWNTVFIVGLSEGQFPHIKASESERQIEEERRLFYVAVTRAKNNLYLVRPITRYDYQMGTVIARKSIFISELDPSLYDRWDIEETIDPIEDFIDID